MTPDDRAVLEHREANVAWFGEDYADFDVFVPVDLEDEAEDE